EWTSNDGHDKVVAEHNGYARLPNAVVHRRTIVFDKHDGSWLIDGEFISTDEHDYEVRFHFAPGLDVTKSDTAATASDGKSQLTITALDPAKLSLENQSTSFDYGEKQESVTACWRASGKVEKLRWQIATTMSDTL